MITYWPKGKLYVLHLQRSLSLSRFACAVSFVFAQVSLPQTQSAQSKVLMNYWEKVPWRKPGDIYIENEARSGRKWKIKIRKLYDTLQTIIDIDIKLSSTSNSLFSQYNKCQRVGVLTFYFWFYFAYIFRARLNFKIWVVKFMTS